MKQQVEWMSASGLRVTVTVSLETSRVVDADGDKVVVPAANMHITAEVETMGVVGYGRPTALTDGPAGYVARIGNLAITAEHIETIKAAISTVEATTEWQAELAKRAAAEREAAEYDAHRAMMRRVMGY